MRALCVDKRGKGLGKRTEVVPKESSRTGSGWVSGLGGGIEKGVVREAKNEKSCVVGGRTAGSAGKQSPYSKLEGLQQIGGGSGPIKCQKRGRAREGVLLGGRKKEGRKSQPFRGGRWAH